MSLHIYAGLQARFQGPRLLNLIFNLIFGGARGPQGLIKIAPGAPGIKKKNGGKFLKIQFFWPEVSTIFEISIFRYLPSKLNGKIESSMNF